MKRRTSMAVSVGIFSVVFGLSPGAHLVHALPFSYSDFSSINNLSLVGDAAQSGSVLRLNRAVPTVIGAAWHTTKHNVANGFETVFDFKITNLGQSNIGELGGDGFAFVIQNHNSTALGTPNSYMGYEIQNSLAVEFDTFWNSWWSTAPGKEPNGNHVGVQSLGGAINTPSWNSATAGAYLGSAVVAPNMSDGSVHTAKVTYVPGTLKVFVDNLAAPALTVSTDLSTLLTLDSGAAYVGFTAGGATAYENHDLLNWSFSSSAVPEPTTLLLFGSGLIGLAGYRRNLKRISAP